jgi:hypothetical protein
MEAINSSRSWRLAFRGKLVTPKLYDHSGAEKVLCGNILDS